MLILAALWDNPWVWYPMWIVLIAAGCGAFYFVRKNRKEEDD